ncbi:MAG: penicillin acylase family protein [Acidimicrobiia bacterium]|nr:penicillin acylase family protein [Acidimicrobiia bacterium]
MRIKGPTPPGVTLNRDEHGVPHIRVDDLAGAYWGMGYCHALDRGMQMGLVRLLGQGRVAECLDPSESSIEIDTFFRRMNWAGHTESQVGALTSETRTLIDSYCTGVNAGFERSRPWEFRLLRYRPEPWTIEDTLLMARVTGYVTLAQSQAEIERLFVEMVQAGIDDDRLEALFPGCLQNLDRELLGRVELGERIVPEELKWGASGPRMMASNNWAVAATHSSTGSALIANDPHLEVNRLPNVWVEQVIELPDDTVLTANMPGLPGPLVGRNRHVGWGATYTFMDAVDSWVEDCRDGAFRRNDEFVPFTERREQILVKKGDPVDVVFHENMHGVLDGDPNVEGLYLATRWAPAESGAATLNATAEVWGARNVEDLQRVLGRIETSWNWVTADSTGRIAYQMSGLFPVRPEGTSGFVPMPGWDPEWDWRGFAEPEELPRVLDPPEGMIVTANNDLNRFGDVDPINMPMGDYRARRIESLLSEDPPDLATFKRIHADTYSLQAEEVMSILRPLLPDSAVGRRLAGWDCHYDLDSRGAALFENFYRELLVEVFAPGGMGQPVVDHLVDTTGIFIDFYQNFDRVLMAETSSWLGDRNRESVFRAAFDRVDGTENRTWGEVNRVTLTNILLGGKLPRWAGFDVGPIAIPGGRATPHQGQIYESAGRQTSFAPSLRWMADMGRSEIHTSLAGGPSDRRFSKWYTSDLERWKRSEYKVQERLGD